MRVLTLAWMERFRDVGLLIMRLGLGGMMAAHGWPKMLGGPDKWAKLGGAMSTFGIDFMPELWGFAASFAELVGGVCVAIGLLTRINAGLIVATMIVAAAMHLDAGDGVMGASHAIEDGFAFLGLVFLGCGRYGLDARLR